MWRREESLTSKNLRWVYKAMCAQQGPTKGCSTLQFLPEFVATISSRPRTLVSLLWTTLWIEPLISTFTNDRQAWPSRRSSIDTLSSRAWFERGPVTMSLASSDCDRKRQDSSTPWSSAETTIEVGCVLKIVTKMRPQIALMLAVGQRCLKPSEVKPCPPTLTRLQQLLLRGQKRTATNSKLTKWDFLTCWKWQLLSFKSSQNRQIWSRNRCRKKWRWRPVQKSKPSWRRTNTHNPYKLSQQRKDWKRPR